jgi:mono/diheme cytochrome c family protein
MSVSKFGLLLLMIPGAFGSDLASIDVDARRGADLFQAQGCINCHLGKGAGRGKAPDLGRRLDRNYTPAGIAARMWSHAPVMWGAMSKQNITTPVINTDQAADLFAYFYAARYFEKLGEAERGKQLFDSKHCSECHSLTGRGIGPSVERWQGLQAPILLIQQMWNHQSLMRGSMTAKNIPWPRLSSSELNDILLYLRNLPQNRNVQQSLLLLSSGQGDSLFRQKGCSACHFAGLALENRLGDSTLTDVAAAMWNHAPQMRLPPPQLNIMEMQQIISYIWAKQFFATKGDALGGHKIFDSKKCVVCHDNPSSGAPALSSPSEPYSAISMVSVLWRHGPSMLKRMQEKHITWPQLSQNEMANLIAYLNSRQVKVGQL